MITIYISFNNTNKIETLRIKEFGPEFRELIDHIECNKEYISRVKILRSKKKTSNLKDVFASAAQETLLLSRNADLAVKRARLLSA